MWIKICGNTNLDDAQLAAELGADAVGFVFAPSPRQVTAVQVAQITPYLPEGVESVGVFPALAAEEIADAALESGLNAVQLHGGAGQAVVVGRQLAIGQLAPRDRDNPLLLDAGIGEAASHGHARDAGLRNLSKKPDDASSLGSCLWRFNFFRPLKVDGSGVPLK